VGAAKASLAARVFLGSRCVLLRGFAGFLASVESDSIPCIWPVWMFVTDRTHNSILFYVGALFF